MEGVGFVPASELRAGDIIRTSEGENLPIDRVETEELEEPVLVYNFEVEDFHTYYVSELGVLVHNTCPVESDSKADLGNKLDYQFGKAGGNKHNIDRTNGLKAEMDKLGFDDTVENRAYFEQYYNDVLNDSSNIVGGPVTASYMENGTTHYYTVTTKESFFDG